MSKKILAICDMEADYAHRMMEVMKTRRDLPFDIHVFTDADKLLAYAHSDNAIECLLVAESAYSAELKELKLPHVFILSESGNTTDEPNTVCINKYQSADNIASKLLANYAEHNESPGQRLQKSGHGAKIIGVYSPVKRCLQTTFSMTMGQILAQKHKTLYLNYECFSGFEQLLSRKMRTDITDMMYLYECVEEKFIYKLSMITEKINNLDFVWPTTIYPDLMNIPGTQWTRLLEKLRVQSDYEYIILDLSDYVNGLLQILMECDCIYTIAKSDLHAIAKIEQYERILCDLKYTDVVEKTKKLNLPIFKNMTSKYDEMTYGELATYIRENLLNDLCQ